jgi:hypothetical protein
MKKVNCLEDGELIHREMKAQGNENAKDIPVNRLYLNTNFYLLKSILEW